MIRRLNLFHSNFFIVAIMISLAWHLLWIAAIKIVIVPDQPQSVKFSRVSFLGPILAGGSAELRLEPKARSFLERRYLAKIAALPVEGSQSDPVLYNGYDKMDGPDIASGDEAFTSAIARAMSSRKLEPPSNLDPIV